MTALSAQSLRKTPGLIAPFYERTTQQGMTFGLSCAGYDIRIAQDIWMWPGRFKLASTIERFRLPKDLLGVVHDKSTWARRGLAVQNTVLEPGWEGGLTLELTMHAWKVIHIPLGTPIAQVVFHRLDHPTELPYRGKYQKQGMEPQKAILER